MKLVPLKETKVLTNALLLARTAKGKVHFFTVEMADGVVTEETLRPLLGTKEELHVYYLKPTVMTSQEYGGESIKTVAAINFAYFDNTGGRYYNTSEMQQMTDRWIQLYDYDRNAIGTAFLNEGMLNNWTTAKLFREYFNSAANKPNLTP